MLAFYTEHGISPVSQDISDLGRHLQRRESLYRLLGLPSLLFEGRTILEVGPGSGHNSLYVASRKPRSYDLVEPNPKAAAEIAALYDGFERSHTRPRILPVTLQDFTPDAPYDIVLCEGWLGNSDADHRLIRKLGGFLRPGGILVLTFVPPVGGLATLFRRLLTLRLLEGISDFETRTQRLVEAFGSHLATLDAMSRPHRDWVQDNLLCLAILGQAQSPDRIGATLGTDFAILGSVPGFQMEWRWYKSLFGPARDFNGVFQAAYQTRLHNLVDYRLAPTLREGARNGALETLVGQLFSAILGLEMSGATRPSPEIADLVALLRDNLTPDLPAIALGIDEVWPVLSQARVTPAEIAALPRFSSWFGRENCYLSLQKESA